MTTPKNNAVNDSFMSAQFPNLAGNSINSGDLVYVDQSTFDLKALDTDAHAQYLVGVCNDTFPIGAYPTSAQVSASIGGGPTYPLQGMNVTRIGRRELFTTNGETYYPNDPLFIGANAQTVTKVAGSYKVGYVANLKDGTQNGLVGTGTNTIQVDIRAAWPTL